MLNDNSALERDETPHTTNSTPTTTPNHHETLNTDVLRRAELLVNDKSIDAESRAWIRYGMEINDPWLPELVRRVEAGESITDAIKVLAESSDI